MASTKTTPQVATTKAPETVATTARPAPDGPAGDLSATGLAYLDVQVKSVVPTGTLTIWVDGEKRYTHQLSAPDDGKRSVKRLFRKEWETFNAWIEIPPGSHALKIQVLVESASSALEETVELGRDEVSKFTLVLGRKKEPISLEAD